ncbi:hypothetical protein F4801DRAFT_266122 [Xylaria longipes]|nr:hypothetical protein F4801DRAFT_266122 [Xylaria longipes]
MITAVRSWRWRRDFCGYHSHVGALLQQLGVSHHFYCYRGHLFGHYSVFIFFSVFFLRSISVRVLYFAPHGSAMIIHWYPNAQIWSLIFEGKGVTTCALRPLTLIGIMRLGITTSLHQAIGRTVLLSIGRPFPVPTANSMEQLVGDSSINTTGRKM